MATGAVYHKTSKLAFLKSLKLRYTLTARAVIIPAIAPLNRSNVRLPVALLRGAFKTLLQLAEYLHGCTGRMSDDGRREFKDGAVISLAACRAVPRMLASLSRDGALCTWDVPAGICTSLSLSRGSLLVQRLSPHHKTSPLHILHVPGARASLTAPVLPDLTQNM